MVASSSNSAPVPTRSAHTLHVTTTSRDHHITIAPQVYNEQVIDLLNPEAGPLGVRESKTHGFFIENLLVVTCETQQDVMEVKE